MKNTKIILLCVVFITIVSTLFYLSFNDTKDIKPNDLNYRYKFPFIESNNEDRELNEPEKLVLEFYKKYFTDFYNNKNRNNNNYFPYRKNGIYQLDFQPYLQWLKDFGYFSEVFYLAERKKYEICNKNLAKLSLEDIDSYPGFPEDLIAGDDCSFLSYYEWTGGQGEFLNVIEIKDSVFINEKTSIVNVAVGYILENDEMYNYSFPKITLIKENEEWKISKIKLQ